MNQVGGESKLIESRKQNESIASTDHDARLVKFGFSRLLRLAGKELLEILRDRRTIVTLVLMPILVYPLLGTIVQKFMLNSLSNIQQIEYLIAAETELEMAIFQRRLGIGNAILNPPKAMADPNDQKEEARSAGKTNKRQVEELIQGKMDREPKIVFVEAKDGKIEEFVASGVFELGVRILNKDRLNKGLNDWDNVEFELIQSSTSVNSEAAYEFVTDRLEAVNDQWVQEVLKRKRVTMRRPNSVRTLSIEAETENASGKPSLLTFIPLMLVLMTMTGAVYPAIDLTAGERERGTMEILMAAPISRMALLFGKFVAVLSVAMLTALMNMVAMFVTVYTLGLDPLIFGEQGIPIGTVLIIFGLLLVFAAFFSAVLLGLTSFARSFKEAQAYLIPVMLVALAPAVLSLFPDIQMTFGLALVPLVNIILLGRDLVGGEMDLGMILITIISTSLYGLLAIGMAARIFGSDAVLSGGTKGWSEILNRSPKRSRAPSLPTAMLFLAVLFPSFIIIGGLATRFEVSIQTRLLINAGVTFLLFVGLPLLFCGLFRLKILSSILLYPPRLMAVIAGVLLGVAVWMFIYEIEVFALSENRMEVLKEVFDSMKIELQQIPLSLKILCLALAPAVCEEFTFRGFLMSSFRKHSPVWLAILVTGVLFGLFHVFVRDALMFERLLPSSLMGVLLGFVCVKTGSVIPGMILHTIHNGLLISMAHFEKELQEFGFGTAEQQHVPLLWLALAVIPVVLGLLILLKTPVRCKTDGDEPSSV